MPPRKLRPVIPGGWPSLTIPRTAERRIYKLSRAVARTLDDIPDPIVRLQAANEIAVATNPKTARMTTLRAIRTYAIRLLFHDYGWQQVAIREWMRDMDVHIVNNAIRVGVDLPFGERPHPEDLPVPAREDETWAKQTLRRAHREFTRLEKAGRTARAFRQDIIRALAVTIIPSKELADLLGLSTGAIAQIRKGTANPTGNTGSFVFDRARNLTKAVIGGELRTDVIYPERLPEELWRWYGATDVHNIVVAVKSLYRPGYTTWVHRQGPWEFLVPAPVRAVLRAGWVEHRGYIVCDLPYDAERGLLVEPGDEESVNGR